MVSMDIAKLERHVAVNRNTVADHAQRWLMAKPHHRS